MKDLVAYLGFLVARILLLLQLLANGIRIDLIVNAVMAESREFTNGKVVRAAVFHYPPSINITKLPDGNISYTGSSIDIMDYVAKGLNITYEYYEITVEDLKKYGPGPAQILAIANGQADIAIFGNVPSLSKYQVTDFSIPILAEPWHIIVPWPKEESRLLAPIRPFQPLVWLGLGLTLLVVSPVLATLSGFYVQYVNEHPHRNPANMMIRRPTIITFASLLHNATFMLSHLTNQGYRYELRLKSRGSYILVGLWCLMCVVLANGYGGVLFSFLSVTKLKQPINTLEELANSKDVQLTVPLGTETARNFMSATKGPEKIIGESLKAHSDNLVRNLVEAKIKLRTGYYAFTFPDFIAFTLLYDLYLENGKKCSLTIMKEPIPFYNVVAFNLVKNGPYTKAINEQMQAMIDAGILDRIWYNHKPNIDRCKMENQKASSRHKTLSLVDMSSAFVVLGLGISLSILVFLIELIYKRINDHYFTVVDRIRPVMIRRMRRQKMIEKPQPVPKPIEQVVLDDVPEEVTILE